MRRGKYERPKSRRTKKPAILIVSLILLLIAAVGGTVAYLQATSGRVTNTFTPAKVIIEPTESVTDTTKSDIKFQNTGNVPVYIRATLVIYWKDADGNFVPQPTGGNVQIGTENAQEGWMLDSASGIYYYENPVAVGSTSPNMLLPIADGDSAEVLVTLVSGYTCHVDVHSEAIQAEGWGNGVDTAQEAWAAAKGAQG